MASKIGNISKLKPLQRSILKYNLQPYGHNYNHPQLVHTTRQAQLAKNFHDEVHAGEDIELFLNSAEIYIEENNDNKNFSISLVLKKLLVLMKNSDIDISHNSMESIKNEIFRHRHSGNNALLSESFQGYFVDENDNENYDQDWIIAMTKTQDLIETKIGFCKTNFPISCGDSKNVSVVMLILEPDNNGSINSGLEIARTFGTMFRNPEIIRNLKSCDNVSEIRDLIKTSAQEKLIQDKLNHSENSHHSHHENNHDNFGPYHRPSTNFPLYYPFYGVLIDLKRRLPFYLSDWTDYWTRLISIKNDRMTDSKKSSKMWEERSKIIRVIFGVIAAVTMPCVAFGAANYQNTEENIDVKNTLQGQIIAGLIFSIFSCQPLGIVMTTPPISIIICLVYEISEDYEADFLDFYGMTGFFIGIWTVLYSIFNLSRFLKYVTPSIEEIFAIFVAAAFINDALVISIEAISTWYNSPEFSDKCISENCVFVDNLHLNCSGKITNFDDCIECDRDKALGWIILECLTAGLSLLLYIGLKHTNYFTKSLREWLSDYSGFLTVILVGAIWHLVPWGFTFDPYVVDFVDEGVKIANFSNLTGQQVAVCFGISIPFALLFYFDQGFTEVVINSPKNCLLKPGGFHWDLFLVGVINIIMSIFGFPWLHMVLPHSDIHLNHVATVKETKNLKTGEIDRKIVPGSVIEQRLTGFLAHCIMMIYLIPSVFDATFHNIPLPVYCGIFWFQGFRGLIGNSVIDRCFLWVQEKNSWSLNDVTKSVPQWRINLFTLTNILQAVILIIVGCCITHTAKLYFPIIILGMMLVRWFLLPYKQFLKYLF